MLRELAGMSAEEVMAWCRARRVEIMAAAMKGDISDSATRSLLDWVAESYATYLRAVGLGLIPIRQVEGHEGGSNER